jgi:2-oxoglutarate ferredoxin oxidoreductase subunit alpha
MRPGPALGMPTWTEQGDLNFIINASHGEFARIVVAPGDAQEAFELSRMAIEFSQKYCVPVVINSDKYLAESRYCFSLEDRVFANKKYEKAVRLITNSYEHDENGFSSEESEMRTFQVKKRLGKLDTIKKEIPAQFLEEEPNSKLTFFSFGSTKGPIRQARQELKSLGIATSMLNFSWVWPFPVQQVQKIIKSSANVVVVEGNYQGQLAQLIASQTGFICQNRLNRYDGRPFYAEEIVNWVKNFKAKL